MTRVDRDSGEACRHDLSTSGGGHTFECNLLVGPCLSATHCTRAAASDVLALTLPTRLPALSARPSTQDYKEGKVLSEQELMMKKHKEEFERIVKEHGLDKGQKVRCDASIQAKVCGCTTCNGMDSCNGTGTCSYLPCRSIVRAESLISAIHVRLLQRYSYMAPLFRCTCYLQADELATFLTDSSNTHVTVRCSLSCMDVHLF